MNAEVIAIGDELTSGQRLDTNSQWLSEQLGQLGIRVLYHTTVGDDLAANVRVFREAFDRAEVIICTGGLGPTADDLTREAIARATNTELVQDAGALAHIEALFAQRKRAMPERNLVQAMFPSGSRVVHNPHGSAPGIDMDVRREGRAPSRIFALPGVPAEMREMWFGTVGPALAEATGHSRRIIRHRRIKCFGVGESDLEAMLPDLVRRGRQPSVGITASHATITLRITSDGESPAACLDSMEPTIATIRECLGDIIFGEEDDELQHAVVRLLAERKQRLATLEWGPGGMLSDWLSDADDAGVFAGGIVVRNDQLLMRSLDIDDVSEQYRAGDSETIRRVMEACRARLGVDYLLSIGAFPDANSTGSVHVALATADGVLRKAMPFTGHPDILKSRAGKQALNFLRLKLLRG